jgi:2-polyprenyl-3-methyl-5-hydroxy-6-metoxy-1,4-benzoquinol methylase
VTIAQQRVLDAGCGRHLHLGYSGINLRDAHVTGIDLSRAALDQNDRIQRKILGDLQTYPLEPEAFDVVICQDVLEHLPRPDKALANMAQALKPGGEILIAVSNPASLKGLVTKFTPHVFHRFVYQRGWFGYTFVDDPAYPPFKTFMRWSNRPSALKRTLQELCFERIDLRLEEPERFTRWWSRHPLLATLVSLWPKARLSECRVRAFKSAVVTSGPISSPDVAAEAQTTTPFRLSTRKRL